jgi:hypothetical protein
MTELGHVDGLICVRQPCPFGHPGHPGIGHCESCIEERDQGYVPLGLFTLRDERPQCCCRDRREAAIDRAVSEAVAALQRAGEAFDAVGKAVDAANEAANVVDEGPDRA